MVRKRMKVKREVTVAMPHVCRKAGCHRAGDYARGVCESCYRGLAQLVSDRVITWEKLEKQGKVAKRRMSLKEWALS